MQKNRRQILFNAEIKGTAFGERKKYLVASAKLQEVRYELVSHPPCSPDLTSSIIYFQT